MKNSDPDASFATASAVRRPLDSKEQS